jgi:hypothetical protein
VIFNKKKSLPSFWDPTTIGSFSGGAFLLRTASYIGLRLPWSTFRTTKRTRGIWTVGRKILVVFQTIWVLSYIFRDTECQYYAETSIYLISFRVTRKYASCGAHQHAAQRWRTVKSSKSKETTWFYLPFFKKSNTDCEGNHRQKLCSPLLRILKRRRLMCKRLAWNQQTWPYRVESGLVFLP